MSLLVLSQYMKKYVYVTYEIIISNLVSLSDFVCDVVLANFAKAFDYPDLVDALQVSTLPTSSPPQGHFLSSLSSLT